MKWKKDHGHIILTSVIFPISMIEKGQLWMDSSGACVTITSVGSTLQVVSYKWLEGETEVFHSKGCFEFQCRYCLVVLGSDNGPISG